ncbi:hypothetical protein BGZ65_007693, partial [Modicella reniformis]
MPYNTDRELICPVLAQPLFEVSEDGSAGCFFIEEGLRRTVPILQCAYDLNALLESMKTDVVMKRLR